MDHTWATHAHNVYNNSYAYFTPQLIKKENISELLVQSL